MTDEPKQGSTPPSSGPDMQAGGAAAGWATHSGHLSNEDFSGETPAAEPTPAQSTQPP